MKKNTNKYMVSELYQTFVSCRAYLLHGDIKHIAQEHGISESARYKITAGRYTNEAFLNSLIEKAIERKSIVDRFKSRIKINEEK